MENTINYPNNINWLQKNQQLSNGRVVNLSKERKKDYKLFNESSDHNTTLDDALQGIQMATTLSRAYFSPEHVQQLHNKIRYQVWLKSSKQFIISQQSDVELKIIMRAIYLQYSKNLELNIPEQIEDLDKHVLVYAVRDIVHEVNQHRDYLNKVETLPVPLQHPTYAIKQTDRTKLWRDTTSTF
jgi:hypothetical protein